MWESLTTLSHVALSYKNAVHKSISKFTPLYTAARQTKVLVLLLVLFPVQIWRAIFSELKGLQREEQTWLESELLGHTYTAELEKVWQQSLTPDPNGAKTLDGYSKTGWSHPSCHIHLLWAACGSSVHLRYRSEEGAGSAHSLKTCNLCCSTSE